MRQRLVASHLGMHATIEDEPLPGGLEVITVRADLSPAREIDELHNSLRGYNHCSKIRIQFRKRMRSISSSLKPRSINRRVKLRLWECFCRSGTKWACVNLF